MNDLEPGATVLGEPRASPHVQWLRNVAAAERLAEMRKELRELEKKLAAAPRRQEKKPMSADSPRRPQIVLDVAAIQQLLPHRHPFLLVDRVVALEPGKRLVGLKNVTMNEPFFVGHFPGQPVMPGVLILEALAQARRAPRAKSLPDEDATGKITFSWRSTAPGSASPSSPATGSSCTSRWCSTKGADLAAEGRRAIVDGQAVAEGEFMAMLADRERRRRPEDERAWPSTPPPPSTPARSSTPRCEIGPFAVIGPHVQIGPARTSSARTRCSTGDTTLGRGEPRLPARVHRARSRRISSTAASRRASRSATGTQFREFTTVHLGTGPAAAA